MVSSLVSYPRFILIVDNFYLNALVPSLNPKSQSNDSQVSARSKAVMADARECSYGE